MASLTAKKVKGRTYYYLRECRRVQGKPKIVRQIYLGSAETIQRVFEQAENPPAPSRVAVHQFGAVSALFGLAETIGIRDIVNTHVPKRDQGLTCGDYLLLAVINRAVHPTSKAALADWYATTVLDRMIPAPPALLASQRFWDHLGMLNEAKIAAIEQDLTRRIVQQYGIDLSALVYDGSNFFTFIDSRTPGELAQRGHNKQKRTDLRQVSLGLLVSTDFHLPLLHVVYPGNVVDATEFKSLSDLLVERHKALSGGCHDITLIFDKGNNSQEAFTTLDNSPYHFVGSLVPSQHEELLDVPLAKFHAMEDSRLEATQAYRTRKSVFGQERTILVTHNPALLEGQLRGLSQHLDKARCKLAELQGRLARWVQGRETRGRAPKLASVERQVREILSAQFLTQLLPVEIGQRNGMPTLSWQTDQNALERLSNRLFGKTILFSDREDWTDEQIVLAYRSQSKIEDVFKLMKHPTYLRWQPQYHWTNEMIRAHAFCCVLAVTLVSLLQRELARKGLTMSIPAILEELCGVYETTFVYPGTTRRPVIKNLLADLTPTQENLLKLLGLTVPPPAASSR